jgi:hypothetical protein
VVGKVLKEMLAVWRYQHPGDANARFEECNNIVKRLLGASRAVETEQDFLTKDFGAISFHKLGLESQLVPVLEARLKELQICLKNGSALSAIFMTGSILEGVLLGVARSKVAQFNQAAASPKDKAGNVKMLHEWTLANLIDVACELRLLGLDVKKFSHAVRDFRNYIHPYQQMSSQFNPDSHTALICFQVLKAAVSALSK